MIANFTTVSSRARTCLTVNNYTHHMMFGNGVWQRCYGEDCGYSLWNFAGEVTYQGLVLRVQPLCSVWLTPSDAMQISTSCWKGFRKELENDNSTPGPTFIRFLGVIHRC